MAPHRLLELLDGHRPPLFPQSQHFQDRVVSFLPLELGDGLKQLHVVRVSTDERAEFNHVDETYMAGVDAPEEMLHLSVIEVGRDDRHDGSQLLLGDFPIVVDIHNLERHFDLFVGGELALELDEGLKERPEVDEAVFIR
jgi:hypothetical protein